ncbi:MAG: hypothetical protein A2297_07585 [Elusimicrobia bacterium RIFOXYB2_FULL_48_7]|nr:MAG: hypothetical protein A2297_07585 [Elusimicrobia bacterium RIFOXYB2_FULL_48_7]
MKLKRQIIPAFLLLGVFFLVPAREAKCGFLDDFEPEKKKVNVFANISLGQRQEILKHYRRMLEEGSEHFPGWRASPLQESVPEMKLELGCGYKNNAFMMSFGKLDGNKSVFTYNGRYDGYDHISTQHIQGTFRYYMKKGRWNEGQVKNKFYPYVEAGVDSYNISCEWESEHIAWILVDRNSGAVLDRKNRLTAHSSFVGAHSGVGFEWLVRKRVFIGIRLLYSYAYSETMTTDDFSTGSGQTAYWWRRTNDYIMRVDLSGATVLSQIGIIW